MLEKCSVCEEENENTVLFCKKCVSPVNIRKISDYTEEDKDFILSLLLNVVAKKKKKVIEKKKQIIDSLFFDQYLNVYWLRPETAVWRTIEAEILKEWDCLQEPLLDLGCGDGINLSIAKGNKFSLEFDTFQGVKLDKKDIYDNVGEEYHPILTNQIEEKISSGIDSKKSLVKKAQMLNTYKEILEGDIHNLPYLSKTFRTVYSNVIKDFENVQPILKEVNRVLQKDGQLILTTPNNKFKKNLFFINEAKKLEEKNDLKKAQLFVNYDRGRSVYSATQKSLEEWKDELQRAGFILEKVITYAPPDLIKLFDIGTRAFSVDIIKKYVFDN